MFYSKDKKGVGGWVPTRWQSYLFNQRAEKGSLCDAVGTLREKLTTEAPFGETIDEKIERVDTVGAESKAFGGEVFGRLYGKPTQGEGEVDWAVAAHRVLDDMPEFQRLQKAVAGDPDFSALAARDLLTVVGDQAANLRQMKEDQDGEEDGDGLPGDGGGDGDGNGNGNGNGMPTAEDIVRSAMRRAVRRISDDMDDTKDMMNGICPGLEAAPPTHQQADDTRYRLAESVKDGDQFKEIMKRAGRLRRIASKSKRTLDRSLREEVVDTERGADLSRVLPSQIAGLRHPVMAKLVKRNIVEKSLIQYRLEGTEHKGRGPVVVLLDRSGSMGGDPEVWASAAAIAMTGMVAREKRAITIIGFNAGITSGVHLDTKGGAHRLTIDKWAKKEAVVEKIDGGVGAVAMHVATEYSHGGTNFARPLRAALYRLPAGIASDNADLIFVTDGNAHVPDEMMADLTAAKAAGLRVFAMTVNGGSVSECIETVCDEVIDIDERGDDGVVQVLAQ